MLIPGQHFVGGFDGTRLTKELKILIQKYQIGGVILFARNIESPRQVRFLNKQLQKIAPIPLLIGVDQEGGPVARLKAPFTELPPMIKVGEYFRRTKDIKTVEGVGRVLGRELSALGFNWDYAPVVDVHSNPKNPIIGKRSFGPDPLVVAKCAAALIQGLHQEGVLSCAKHFPGHGSTSVDSHKDLPVVKTTGRLLWKRDIFPYRKLIAWRKLATLMTAHVRYTELDSEHCATLSADILQNLLRGRLKYRGLIVSDDLWMKAISDRIGIPEAALQFFKAGGDMAMICKEPAIQIEAIEVIQQSLKKDAVLRRHFKKSARRLEKIKNRFCVATGFPPLSILGHPTHKALIEKVTSHSIEPAEV